MQNFKKQVLANSGLKEILNDSKKGNIFMYGFDVKKGRSKLKWVIQGSKMISIYLHKYIILAKFYLS